MKKLILQDKKECWFCKTTFKLHHHEVFYGTANRKKSIEYGCQVWLCSAHHNFGKNSVHYNHDMDVMLKRYTQREFEKVYGREKFLELFHKNYLTEGDEG